MSDLPKIPVREIPKPEPRKRPTPRQIVEILLRQDGRCTCGVKIGGATPYQVDHIQPLELLGGQTTGNLQCLCEPCHKAKTATDISAIAKGRRLRGETCTRSTPIRSRGFDKTLRKRMNGTVERRTP